MPGTVIFDLDDTLCDYTGARSTALEMIAATTTDPTGFLRCYLATEPGLFAAFADKQITLAEYRAKRFSVPLSAVGEAEADVLSLQLNRVFMRACNEELAVFPEVADTLTALKRAGWQVGLLTNGPSDGQRTKIRSLGLTSFFDAIAIGEEIGCFKPDPRALAACVSMLGSDPSATWMVGDSLDMDVQPALNAGFRTILVARGATSPSVPPGVLVAADLAVAAEWLTASDGSPVSTR